MKWGRAGLPSQKELALVKKALKRNPGCSIRMTRGAGGEPNVQLIRGTDRASRLAQLRGHARRADLLLLQAHTEERYRRALSR
jgi:hypothetical protein